MNIYKTNSEKKKLNNDKLWIYNKDINNVIKKFTKISENNKF